MKTLKESNMDPQARQDPRKIKEDIWRLNTHNQSDCIVLLGYLATHNLEATVSAHRNGADFLEPKLVLVDNNTGEAFEVDNIGSFYAGIKLALLDWVDTKRVTRVRSYTFIGPSGMDIAAFDRDIRDIITKHGGEPA